MLVDVVGGRTPIVAGSEATVLADRAKAVEDSPLGHPRGEPEHRVGPPRAGDGPRAGPQEGLNAQDRDSDGAALLRAGGEEQHLEVLPARDPDGIPDESPTQVRPMAWIAGVEVDVGIVGAELLLVVREVTSPIEGDRHEGWVGDEPLANEVVGTL